MHNKSHELKLIHELSGRVEALRAMVIALARIAPPDQLAQLADQLDEQVLRKLDHDVSEQGTDQRSGFSDVLSEIRTNVPAEGDYATR